MEAILPTPVVVRTTCCLNILLSEQLGLNSNHLAYKHSA